MYAYSQCRLILIDPGQDNPFVIYFLIQNFLLHYEFLSQITSVLIFGSLPPWRRTLQISMCSYDAAKWRGVYPCWWKQNYNFHVLNIKDGSLLPLYVTTVLLLLLSWSISNYMIWITHNNDIHLKPGFLIRKRKLSLILLQFVKYSCK